VYHHAEAVRSEVPIARRYRPTLFRIGKWRWRTGIPALAEIAAGAFAQSLLDLPHYSKALDFIAVDVIRAATWGVELLIGRRRPRLKRQGLCCRP
jgi:hypothetical protein